MNDVIDKTQQNVEKPAAGDKPPASGKEIDAGSPKSGKAEAAQQIIDGILSKHELQSPEDLGKFLDDLVGLKSKVGDHDIDELLESRDTLIQYHTQWAAQEEKRKREAETPEETVERLSKELKKRDDLAARQKAAEREARENDKLLSQFNTFVSREVKGLDDLGQHLKPWLIKYLGVNNPIHDHDLSDREGIKKLVLDAAKEMAEMEKAILKKHGIAVDGAPAARKPEASGTPKVATDGESVSDALAAASPQIKNLKQARRSAADFLRSRLQGGR